MHADGFRELDEGEFDELDEMELRASGGSDVPEDEDPPPCADITENPIAIGGVLSALLGIAYLAVTSIHAVPPLHYGIRCNQYNKWVETDQTYQAGRYFLGPWNSFLLFPAAVQSVEFTNEVLLQQLGARFEPLHTRTKEGLALHLQVSVQYKLNPDKVGELYQEFSHDYENFFVSQMRDTLIKVAAEYEGSEFWERRAEISETMQRTLANTLKRTYADCWGFQLMNIELPPDYDEEIVKTQVVRQNIATQEFEQIATQIRATTDVIEAEFAKKVKIIKAHGIANQTLQVKWAKAKARSHTLDVEAEILDKVKARLKLDTDSLVEYQEYGAVSMLPNASLFFGFEDGSGVMMQPGRPASTGDDDSGMSAHAPNRLLGGGEL